jgi:hypothetical protein
MARRVRVMAGGIRDERLGIRDRRILARALDLTPGLSLQRVRQRKGSIQRKTGG